MRKELIALRLESETIAQIKQVATEGNVSQWIRLLIQKELDKMLEKQIKDDMSQRIENGIKYETTII